jgi:8-oxo-dGTP pyrophosphatase MutT (NUDIX family)
VEKFSIPGVGGIIIKNIDNVDHILIQERCKESRKAENGLIEIPAGKIREFESIFDCLRREIWEETGLRVEEIDGEAEAFTIEVNGYRVINYTPFSSTQNVEGDYPIMVQTFICSVEGELIERSNETINLRWISLRELKRMLCEDETKFYPMHIGTLRKFLQAKRV